MFIRRVIESIVEHGIDYALVGGYAVALHGAVRGTVDIDLVIKLDQGSYQQIEAALKSIGLEPRLPVRADDVFNFREEYIRNRNMIAWSFVNPDNLAEMVDVIVTEDLAQLRSVSKQAFGMDVKILSMESLIAMKRKSGRRQDLEDIKALEALS
ncbi:MAG: DUF6036 family nucleotidyltransferase [Mariprofundaceae bacterium]